MSFEKIDPPLTPEERQAAMGYLHNYMAVVSAMGANDEEIPLAMRFLQELQDASNVITSSRWEQLKNRLGDPFDKNTNYH